MNNWLLLLAYLIGGMVLKWLLDLFFLRRVYHETEIRLQSREAEFTSIKHEHSKCLTDLKSKLVELDATAKSKVAAEAAVAKQVSNLVALRAHVLTVEKDLLDSGNREKGLQESCASLEKQSQEVAARLSFAEEEARLRSAENEALRLQIDELQSAAKTHASVVAERQKNLETCLRELEDASTRSKELEAELAGQRSVTATLGTAVQSRDGQLTRLSEQQALTEAEYQRIEKVLEDSTGATESQRQQLAQVNGQFQAAMEEVAKLETELQARRSELDSAMRSRAAAESLTKQRESEVAQAESTLARLQQVSEETAAEHQKLLKELSAVRRESAAGREFGAKLQIAEKASAESTKLLEQAQIDLQKLQVEATDLGARLARSEQARIELEARNRESTVPAALVPGTGPVGSKPSPDIAELTTRMRELEAELEAVSASHAQLETDLNQERQRVRELTEKSAQLSAKPPVPNSDGLATSAKESALLVEIDELNRERNALAAELAAMKSELPASGSNSGRRRRVKESKGDLFEDPGLRTPATPQMVSGPSKNAVETDPESATRTAEEPSTVKEFSTRCPQHLSDVKGIGPVFETRLYSAGVGSYWELSLLSDRALTEVLELEETQREKFDFEATRSDAARLAGETKTVGRKWTGETPDDLEPLEGIGPTIEKRLYDAGICTYKSLASASEQQLAEICPPTKFRGANYAHWITQARERLASEET